MTGELPLEGFTVLSLEQAVAAPFATRLLADLGARVIKVERTQGGDFARGYDAEVRGIASHFVWLNRSKESVALDLKTDAGREALERLVKIADVVIQNLAPGSSERLGLGAEKLRAQRPELVVVDLSGYGAAGPYRDRKAFDMLVQAEAGLVAVTGTADHPAKTGIPSADIAAGLHASHAILAALLRRSRTGEGAHLEISMFDALAEWMGHPLYTAMYGTRKIGRYGLAHPAIAPYDAFPASDGQVLIGVQNDRQWHALAEALGSPEMADKPAYATNIERVAHRRELDSELAGHTSTHVAAELLGLLNDAGVPAARITELSDLPLHPQLQDRARWSTVSSEAGDLTVLRPPVIFADVEPQMGPIPALGQHSDAVLAEVGYTAAELAELRAAGAIA